MVSVLRPGQRIINIPGIGVQTSRRAVSVAAAADWWAAGGAPTPIAVYQPKGAADLRDKLRQPCHAGHVQRRAGDCAKF